MYVVSDILTTLNVYTSEYRIIWISRFAALFISNAYLFEIISRNVISKR